MSIALSDEARLQELDTKLSEKRAAVASGPFEYNNYGLRAKVEQNYTTHRIGRCSSDHLIYLLTYEDPGPLLTKKGKPRVHQPAPHKDETGAFYQAQLIHYGLRPLKDKKRAKKLLMEAAEANGRRLIVPASIEELKSQLAQEYHTREEEAKKIAKEIKEMREAMAEKASTKRATEEDELFIDAFGHPPSRKKAKIDKSQGSVPRLPQHVTNLSRISGTYTIAAPEMRNSWDCGSSPMTIKLGLSSTGSHIWGRFDLGQIEGTVRSVKLSSRTRKGAIKFQWRGRTAGEGESTFGRRNVLTIRFCDDNTFQGEMYWDLLGNFDIAGKKVIVNLKNKVVFYPIRNWKAAYRELNESNYEVERVSRWGKWVEDAQPDKPEDSDTTGAGDDDEDDDY